MLIGLLFINGHKPKIKKNIKKTNPKLRFELIFKLFGTFYRYYKSKKIARTVNCCSLMIIDVLFNHFNWLVFLKLPGGP